MLTLHQGILLKFFLIEFSDSSIILILIPLRISYMICKLSFSNSVYFGYLPKIKKLKIWRFGWCGIYLHLKDFILTLFFSMPSARLLHNHLSLSIDIVYAALNPQSQQLNNRFGNLVWFGSRAFNKFQE